MVCGKKFNVKPSQYERRETCSRKCKGIKQKKVQIGENAANWKGGIEKHKRGYLLQYAPNHPNAINGKVMQHRLIFEKHIGRYLEKNEVIHHINENKTDNRIDNLELMNRSTHAKYHNLGKNKGE